MSREVHVRFCERPEVKFLRPTHPYIAIARGLVYLAAILDAWSRRVVGYAIGRRIDARLTLVALRAAIEVPPGTEASHPLVVAVHHLQRRAAHLGRRH